MKLTVAKKMSLLVLTALLGIVALTGVGLYQIAAVYENTNYANVNTVPSLLGLGKINTNFQFMRSLVWMHVASDSDAEMRELEQKIDAAHAGLEENLKKYAIDACLGASCISDDKEKELVDIVKTRLVEYDAQRVKVMDLSRAHKSKDAMALGREQMVPASGRMQEAIDADLIHNQELGAKGAEDGAASKKLATTISLIVGAVTLFVLALLGIFITRNLLQQLGGEPDYAADVVSQVAGGDLTVQVMVKPGDTSSMLAAIKGMTDKLSAIVAEIRASATSIASASESRSSRKNWMSAYPTCSACRS